jgi:hypothetical protein
MSDLGYRSLVAVCILCGLNFVVFVVIAMAIGGDAVNGKVVGGHFYLANHGRRTEVSEAVFTYSRWHVYSLIVTHPLAMLTGYLAKTEQAARKLRRSSDSAEIGRLPSST